MIASRLKGALCAALASSLSFAATVQAAGVSGQGTWETTLQARDLNGDGATDAYYDTVLNITWLADANLAASNTFGTSGINAAGYMNWGTANTWIANMNAANYLGFDDWRLPTMIDIGNDLCNFAYSGTDCGYNVLTGDAQTTVYSEMASMFYDTLGNLAKYDTSGNIRQLGWGLTNTGPFSKLQSSVYWSGLEYAPTSSAWDFNFDAGNQSVSGKVNNRYAWAVRPGDVVVPVPAAVWLFGSGLMGLLGVGVRRRTR